SITARIVSAMLSPVSPSATGNTLRSFTSWRRAPRCRGAVDTTRRKRSMEGSGMSRAPIISPPRPPCHAGGLLGGLGDLVGLQAAGADVDTADATAVGDPHPLEGGVK